MTHEPTNTAASDEAVELALNAWFGSAHFAHPEVDRRAMRGALTAAGVPELSRQAAIACEKAAGLVAERDRLAGEKSELQALLDSRQRQLLNIDARVRHSEETVGMQAKQIIRLIDRTTAAEAELAASSQAKEQALARVAELEAEVARLEFVKNDYYKEWVIAHGRLTAAESKLAECERDAARIDWLAERFKTCTVRMNGQHPYYPNMHKLRDLKGPTFRAAIDAAIAARGESNGA